LSEIILTLEGVDPVELYGQKNANLHLFRAAFPEISITARGSNLKLSGEKKYTQKAKMKFETMVRMVKEHKELSTQTVEDLLNGGNPYQNQVSSNGNGSKTIVHGRGGKVIKAKTHNQLILVDAAEKNDVVFAVGPAGTGKTYIAVALAVKALKNKTVKKIILTRPAVEAGESLGFLPGDLNEKIDPYLRPLFDALDDMFPPDKLAYFMQNGIIEIAPLAFMRGRTLDNAFIILDEAQNTTTMQIKMFLTRLGPNAKAIITGDLSQIDLPGNVSSGLRRATEVLSHLQGIATVRLTADDVVRHRLVKDIIMAYEKANEEWAARKDERQRKSRKNFRGRAERNEEEE
jgi:phosphate starvation-inducible PhoH-like protein